MRDGQPQGAGERVTEGEAAPPARLILFDLDGTLVHAAGAGRRALERAVQRCFGAVAPMEGRAFAGRSDVAIFRELALRSGVTATELQRRWGELVESYLQLLDEELRTSPVAVLPGVLPLLEWLRRRDDVVVALGTGNLEAGARLKLRRAGLESYFAVGGFGADGEARWRILQAARRRAAAFFGRPMHPVVVVGDTPLDVQAARQAGYLAVAVATGPYSVQELQASGAEAVLPDLGDWPGAARLLMALAASGAEPGEHRL